MRISRSDWKTCASCFTSPALALHSDWSDLASSRTSLVRASTSPRIASAKSCLSRARAKRSDSSASRSSCTLCSRSSRSHCRSFTSWQRSCASMASDWPWSCSMSRTDFICACKDSISVRMAATSVVGPVLLAPLGDGFGGSSTVPGARGVCGVLCSLVLVPCGVAGPPYDAGGSTSMLGERGSTVNLILPAGPVYVSRRGTAMW
mmetsp:Transcript_11863/g.24601  ORF Transcript_11863/g.24601 Transcript_11863/m.24601 type:complete len:205 (-) Transcript_11863:104-718(-)